MRYLRSVRHVAIALVAVLGLAGGAARATPIGYNLITPYDEPGAQTTVTGVNNAGYMTGDIKNVDGTGAAFVRDPSGDYKLFENPVQTTTQAGDINNDNVVVANSLGPNKNTQRSTQFIRAPDGALTALTVPKTGAKLRGAAHGINDDGVVVGDQWVRTGGDLVQQGYIASNKKVVPLAIGTATSARGINAAGKVVGWARTAPNVVQGFVFNQGHVKLINDPNAPAGASTTLEAINAHGLAVGEWTGADGNSHPFEYDLHLGTFTELAPPVGGPSFFAVDVNDQREVALTNDQGINLLYNPLRNPSGVPEPASWSMMLIGVGALGSMLRNRRPAKTRPRYQA